MVHWTFSILLACLGAHSLHAQLTVSSPLNNQVMQRDSLGSATIPVTAYASFPYAKITAYLIPIEDNVHQAKEWSSDENQAVQGFLNTSFKAETGWYKLKIVGFTNLGITDSVIVPRVGIGEVFLVAGNSNAMGLPGLGSKDASASVVSVNAINKILNSENITVAPDEPMQQAEFDVLKNDHYIFPSGETSWYWGELGHMLSKRWNTPVLFFNAAWAAANSENYRDAASGKDAYNLYVGKYWPNRQPYSNIVNTLRYFTSWTGIRTILWSHGENDAQLGFKENDYFENIRTLIQNSRNDSGYNIPWLIAGNSASNRLKDPYLPILNAQSRLSEIKNFNTFRGPYLDTIQIPRPASEHFENIVGGVQGLTLAATAWNHSLSDSVIKKMVPVQPGYSIHTGVTPARLFPGASFLLPYRISGAISVKPAIQAELLSGDGNYVATVGSGSDNPIQIDLPKTLADGSYKIRLTGINPTLPGSVSKTFYIDNTNLAIEYVNTINTRLIDEDMHVSWLIAPVPGLQQMILQKTTDGIGYSDLENFDAPPTGQSGVYSFRDQNHGKGPIFYRLKMRYQSGQIAYSIVVTVFQDGGPPPWTVFPNPVTQQQFYLRPSGNQAVQCKLFDVAGREHRIHTSDLEVIGLITVRPYYPLPPGKYIVKVISGTDVITRSIVFR